MRIVINSRDGSFARIFGYDDAGKELFQTNRDIVEDLKEAVAKGVPLEEIVAAKMGAAYEAQAEVPREVSVVTVERTAPHAHPEYLHIMPEHAHPRAADTERDVLVAVSRVEQFTAAVQGELRKHSHDTVPHTHDEVAAHRHDHTHVDILEPVSQMQKLIGELSASIASVKKVQSQERILTALAAAESSIEQLKAHEHPHEHSDLAALVAQEQRARESAVESVRFNATRDFTSVLEDLKQHKHPAEAHDHPHTHEALISIIKALETRLETIALSTGSGPHSHAETADAIQSIWENLVSTNRKVDAPHEHPHGHSELENRIEAAASKVGAHEHPVPQHEHVHNHPAGEHALQELTAEVTRLNGVIAALERRLDSHGHEYLSKLPEHEHGYLKAMPEHEHPKAEIRQQAWVVLSEQEVAGKRRLVVEEAS